MIRALQLLSGLLLAIGGGWFIWLRKDSPGGVFNVTETETLWLVAAGLVLTLLGLVLFLMGLSPRAKVEQINWRYPENAPELNLSDSQLYAPPQAEQGAETRKRPSWLQEAADTLERQEDVPTQLDSQEAAPTTLSEPDTPHYPRDELPFERPRFGVQAEDTSHVSLVETPLAFSDEPNAAAVTNEHESDFQNNFQEKSDSPVDEEKALQEFESEMDADLNEQDIEMMALDAANASMDDNNQDEDDEFERQLGLLTSKAAVTTGGAALGLVALSRNDDTADETPDEVADEEFVEKEEVDNVQSFESPNTDKANDKPDFSASALSEIEFPEFDEEPSALADEAVEAAELVEEDANNIGNEAELGSVEDNIEADPNHTPLEPSMAKIDKVDNAAQDDMSKDIEEFNSEINALGETAALAAAQMDALEDEEDENSDLDVKEDEVEEIASDTAATDDDAQELEELDELLLEELESAKLAETETQSINSSKESASESFEESEIEIEDLELDVQDPANSIDEELSSLEVDLNKIEASEPIELEEDLLVADTASPLKAEEPSLLADQIDDGLPTVELEALENEQLDLDTLDPEIVLEDDTSHEEIQKVDSEEDDVEAVDEDELTNAQLETIELDELPEVELEPVEVDTALEDMPLVEDKITDLSDLELSEPELTEADNIDILEDEPKPSLEHDIETTLETSIALDELPDDELPELEILDEIEDLDAAPLLDEADKDIQTTEEGPNLEDAATSTSAVDPMNIAALAATTIAGPPEHDEDITPPAPILSDEEEKLSSVSHPRLQPVKDALDAKKLEEADILLAEIRRNLVSEGDENTPELAELTALAGDHAAASGRPGGAKWLWRLALQRFGEAEAIETPAAKAVSERLRQFEH